MLRSLYDGYGAAAGDRFLYDAPLVPKPPAAEAYTEEGCQPATS